MDIMQFMQNTQIAPAAAFGVGTGGSPQKAAAQINFAALLGIEMATAAEGTVQTETPANVPAAIAETAEPGGGTASAADGQAETVGAAEEIERDRHTVAPEGLPAIPWTGAAPERAEAESPGNAAAATTATLAALPPPETAAETRHAPVQSGAAREAPLPARPEAQAAAATAKAEPLPACPRPDGPSPETFAAAQSPPEIMSASHPAAAPPETATAEKTPPHRDLPPIETPPHRDLPPIETPPRDKPIFSAGRETPAETETAKITVEQGPQPPPPAQETAVKAPGSVEAAAKEPETAPKDGGDDKGHRAAGPVRDGDPAMNAQGSAAAAVLDGNVADKGPAAAKPPEAPVFSLGRTYLQIAQKIPEPLAEGETSLQLKLFPEGLGEVTVRLLCHGDRVSVEIIAATAGTQKLLEGQSAELRTALEAKSYEVTGLAVNGQDNDGANAFAQWRQREENPRRKMAIYPGQDNAIPYSFEAAHPVFGGFDCRV